MKKIFFFSIFFIFLFAMTVCASNKISPAIDVIAGKNDMIKSSVPTSGEIGFDIDDFDHTLGSNVESIKITSLPASKDGRLMVDNLYVVENQVIKREDFSLLKYVSKNGKDVSFKFKPSGCEYEIECVVIPLSSVNLSPVASNGASVSASTIKNIACFGTLLGYDPEGDELEFEIVSYPKKALVCLTNASTGDYVYTPYKNARGKDVFSYRVKDEYGNYSETCTVEVKIENKKTDYVFTDVKNTDLYAVTTVCEMELMKASINSDGSYSFNPNEEITKEEFIVLVMTVMGARDVPRIEKTRFADDKDIKPEYKGYIESAFSLGIIKGESKVDGVYINPKSSITLADASVIINRILGLKTDTCLAVFADEEQIPTYAKESIEALTEAGIIKKNEGNISPTKPLTKAQVATILMSLLKYKK